MVSNSVAIQTGRDPATARMAFYWGRRADGRPDALFPDRGVDRLWFGNGVRVDDRLVLFFGRTITVDTGAGFEHVGWTAVMVENPDAEPSAWRVRPLDTPANPLGILVGFAAVMRMGDHVYTLGSQNPVKSHPIFAARWRAEEVRRGSLQAPEWWAGDRLGWVTDSSSTQRWPLFEEGASELSVHLDPATQRFIAVQTRGFGPADVMMRAAPSLTGPWSAPRLMYPSARVLPAEREYLRWEGPPGTHGRRPRADIRDEHLRVRRVPVGPPHLLPAVREADALPVVSEGRRDGDGVPGRSGRRGPGRRPIAV